MASKSTAFFLVLVLATCSLVLIMDVEAAAAAAADCKLSSLGCFTAESAAVSLKTQNRKIVAAGLKEQDQELLVGVELRRIPSGPDPLHHNGNAPKKPRSDP